MDPRTWPKVEELYHAALGRPITRLELVQNWFAELERLAPTRRPYAAPETPR